MGKITVVNKKTVGLRLKRVGLLAILAAGAYFSYPYVVPVAEKGYNEAGVLIEKGVHEIDSRLAYRSVNKVIEGGSYSKARKAIDDARERLDEKQISELEAKITDFHPDNLVARARQLELPEKIDLLKKACTEYQAIGINKKDVVKEYAEARFSELAEEFKMNEESSKINETIRGIFDDSLLFAKSGETTYTKNDIEVSQEMVDKIFASEAGYIADFFKSYVTDTKTEEDTKNGDVKAVRERIDRLDSAICNSLTLADYFNPKRKADYLSAIASSCDEQAKTIISSGICSQNKLKALFLFKSLERERGFKFKTDLDKYILEYARAFID